MSTSRSMVGMALTAVLAALVWLIPAGQAGPASSQTAPAKKPTATGPARRTVFAAPFENATGQEQYDPAAAGMGDLVAVMLAHRQEVRVVERQRLRLLTQEQAMSLKGLTGGEYAVAAGKILRADTVLTGRLYLVEGKLTVSAKAIDIPTERVASAAQVSFRPEELPEASLQLAKQLAAHMTGPLPEIDLKRIDTSPVASLHFAKALGHYYAGNMDAAIMQFMRTMDLDPDYTEAHYWSGVAYSRLGEDAHAIIEWQAFLKREPDAPAAKAVRAMLAEAKQREKNSPIQRLGPTSAPAGRGGGER